MTLICDGKLLTAAASVSLTSTRYHDAFSSTVKQETVTWSTEFLSGTSDSTAAAATCSTSTVQLSVSISRINVTPTSSFTAASIGGMYDRTDINLMIAAAIVSSGLLTLIIFASVIACMKCRSRVSEPVLHLDLEMDEIGGTDDNEISDTDIVLFTQRTC